VRELTAELGTGARVLMLGCGNSLLSEVLYDAGYTNIVNIDYSAVVIEQMKARHAESRPKMSWLEMDVTDLKFEDEFDAVIDKATME
jgi:2-polyprenyl-3-methyl-5-hydroxy-6-metoxy-1,4-benzoquinol methylase